MKNQYQALDKDFRLAETYINKVQPIKGFNQICNALHNILTNKQDINNLIVFEHAGFHEFIEQNNLNTASKLKNLEYESDLPQMPVIQEAKLDIRRQNTKR